MKYITITNWNDLQHYKDRKPKWLKLYIDIINEFDEDGYPKKFYPLPDSAKLTLLLLCCYRATFNVHIPYQSDTQLKKAIGIQSLDLQPLINAGFIRIDTETIQDDTESVQGSTDCLPPEKEKEKEKEKDKAKELFNSALTIYPGIKRGLDTEFENFTKKHKDWKSILPILKTSIEQQIENRQQLKAAKKFVPEWKHFKTWINNRSWEESLEPICPDYLTDGKLCVVCHSTGYKFQNNKENKPVYLCKDCYPFIQGIHWGPLPIETIRRIVSSRKMEVA